MCLSPIFSLPHRNISRIKHRELSFTHTKITKMKTGMRANRQYCENKPMESKPDMIDEQDNTFGGKPGERAHGPSLPIDASSQTKNEPDEGKGLLSGYTESLIENIKHDDEYNHGKPMKKTMRDQKPESSSLLYKSYQFVMGALDDSQQETNKAIHKDNDALQKRHLDFKRQLKDAKMQLDEQHQMLVNQAQREHDELTRQCQMECSRLQAGIRKLEQVVATLKRKISEDEAVVTKAHETMMSQLAQDVSRDFPDDEIRTELQKFFQGDFFSWCADVSAQHFVEPQKVEVLMDRFGIINSSHSYNTAPSHLKFEMNMPDGSSPLTLLQSALSSELCHSFLTDPYFLVRGSPMDQAHEALAVVYGQFSAAQQDAAIDWRVQTVALLEKTLPPPHERFVQQAESFVARYGCLLNDMDQQAMDDLVSIISSFAKLALRLWRTRTNIHVQGMHSLAEKRFQLGSGHMDGDTAAVAAFGQRLNGRPIGVLMRPLIMSEPITTKQGEERMVVWSKALAWVSCRELGGDGMKGAQ